MHQSIRRILATSTFSAVLLGCTSEGVVPKADPQIEAELLRINEQIFGTADQNRRLEEMNAVNPELVAAFEELLATGDRAAAAKGWLNRYPKCMHDHGLAVDETLSTGDLGPIVAVATVLVQQMLELQAKAGPNDPIFKQTTRDTQQLIMKADSDCRSKAHDTAISRVELQLPDFVSKWESELNKSAARYAELTS